MICVRCGINERASYGRYCLACHAAYMRNWRKTHPLSEENRRRDNARSYANEYRRRGKLTPEPCKVCESTVDVQMHHPDYGKPLQVEWLCRDHHLELEWYKRSAGVRA